LKHQKSPADDWGGPKNWEGEKGEMVSERLAT